MDSSIHKRSKNVITLKKGGHEDTDILSGTPARVDDSIPTEVNTFLGEATTRDNKPKIQEEIVTITSTGSRANIENTYEASVKEPEFVYYNNTGGKIHSIFDIPASNSSKTKVTLPQILTVFASESDKKVVEKEAKDCILPSISENNHAEVEKLDQHHEKKSSKPQKKKTAGLFDFRALETQEIARKKQIRRLRQQGYRVSHDSHLDSRFVARPYEGSCDNISKIKDASPKRSPKHSPNSSSPRLEQKQGYYTQNDIIADPDALAKIEAAFSEWNARKLKGERKLLNKERKRSSSHSPIRNSSQSTVHDKPSCNGEKFLNEQGNLRHRNFIRAGIGESSTGATYRAIASPACSRRRVPPKTFKTRPNLSITTIITPLQSSPVLTRQTHTGSNSLTVKSEPVVSDQSGKFIRNKILNELEGRFSSSLPALDLHTRNKALVEMERKSLRPRTSSLTKPRPPSAGKSPKPTRKRTPKTKNETKNGIGDKGKNGEKKPASPAATRRVMLNTSLPTASPTFQRAMKGMDLPEKDYSEIFVRNRRDSILQSYTIPENALNSFRDDHELDAVESSSTALEEMTNKFRDDLKDYKGGWDPKTEEKKRKSILKKRRQSVDDMEISTRKNLAKYLESKLDISGVGKLPSKNLSFT
ncbi:uncharacterized protein LOC120347971 [Styela clava]